VTVAADTGAEAIATAILTARMSSLLLLRVSWCPAPHPSADTMPFMTSSRESRDPRGEVVPHRHSVPDAWKERVSGRPGLASLSAISWRCTATIAKLPESHKPKIVES
jgi:hypothetical protein